MKASKVNAINKIAIKGDRAEPVIVAIQDIKINHHEGYWCRIMEWIFSYDTRRNWITNETEIFQKQLSNKKQWKNTFGKGKE